MHVHSCICLPEWMPTRGVAGQWANLKSVKSNVSKSHVCTILFGPFLGMDGFAWQAIPAYIEDQISFHLVSLHDAHVDMWLKCC